MATRKKPPQKHYDIMTGMEIVEKEPEKQPEIELSDIGNPIILHGLVAGDKPPTVDDVIKREYPDVLLHPEPVVVQIAILRELIRMRGCE